VVIVEVVSGASGSFGGSTVGGWGGEGAGWLGGGDGFGLFRGSIVVIVEIVSEASGCFGGSIVVCVEIGTFGSSGIPGIFESRLPHVRSNALTHATGKHVTPSSPLAS
jgi:hypothetical protein